MIKPIHAHRLGDDLECFGRGLTSRTPHAGCPRRFDPGRDDWGRVQRTLVEEAEARVVDLERQLAALESGDKLCELT